MNRFDRIDPTNFSFGLWDASFTKGLAVNATSTSDFLDSFASHFDTAVTLSTSNGKKGTTKPERICFCRCTLSASATGQGSMRLGLEIRWTIGLSVFDTPGQRATMRMELNTLSKYLPEESSDSATAWALSDFYDSVHVPPTTEDIPPRIEEMMNDTQLYPFQRRAISWLLRRESVAYKESGGLSTIEDGAANLTPVSFKATQDASGRSCYVSHLRGMVVTDLDPIQDAARTLRGGILAEEMGLGKTVELLALISHHKRVVPDGKIRDPYLGTLVTPSGATLIITPPSILDQWRQEIATHAPELKVFHYKGLPPPSAPQSEHEEATMNHLSKFDIVLTTYQVLSREIHFATPPPDRSLRHVKVHQRRESPLVQISWWRVCLDEAQMVESGVSQAATVARIIPRCNAWAVSGTPLRKDIQDLRGLLIFLRHEPYAGSKAIWDRLDKASFRDVFNRITLRHTKDKIRAELSLPAQKRVVITVPFTAIEEHNYSGLIGQMCRACYLSQDGLPLRDDRGPDHPEVVERMREWLVRLRQTCLHANVGSRNKKALGAKNGPLRTVDEVLEVMIEQNDTSLKAEARELISCELMRAHVQANAKNIENRSAIALETYEVALKRAQDYVQICRNELALEKKKIGTHSITKDGSDQNSDDEEDDDQADKTGRIAVLRRNLRSFLELEHACHFFIGNMYYQTHSNEKLVKPGSEECQRLERMETEAYDRAKAIRKEILKQPQGRAHGYMKTIKPEAPSCIREIDELPDEGGIESRRILEMMDNVVNVLNAQVGQLREWRSKIVGILTMPLVDQDENKDITGDEYEDSTKVQDELYVYIMALRTITADRNTTVTAVKNELIEHELKEALKTARPRPDNDETKRGHAPELVLEVGRIRHNLMPKESDGTLKGVIAAARSLVTTLQYGADGGDVRAQGELAIVKKHLHRIQAISNEQEKAITELEKEQDLFRATMNQRLEFYRQLQHISDTVAPWREELDEELDQREYNRQVHLIHNREQALAGFKTKLVYLNNLRGENQPGTVHICGICMDDEGFEVGVLTSCGHKVS
jgi:E3 ubiquitin-protein ligase SHPRH